MGSINIRLTAEAMARNMVEKGKNLDFDYTQGINAFNNGANNPKFGDNAYLAKQVADLVKNEVRLYKNDCQAQLEIFLNKAKEYLANKAPTKAGLYNIVEVALPEICKDANELGLFKSLNDSKIEVPPFTAVEITDIASDTASINKYLKDMFPIPLSAEEVSELLTTALGFMYPQDLLINIDKLVKAWAIVNFFKEKSISCGLSSLQLVQVLDTIDNKINKALQLHEEYVRVGRIVIAVDESSTSIPVYVVKEVYDSLVGFPGVVDALFGVAIRSDKTYTYSGNVSNPDDCKYKEAFLKNREILIRDWNTYLASNNTENAYTRYKRIRYGYQLAFTSVLEDIAPELLVYSTYRTKGEMLEAFIEYMSKLELYDTTEFIEEMAYQAIGKILFNRTNYARFMAIGDKYLANNPDIEPNDIIGYIIVELVTELYLGKMKSFDL